MLGFSDAKMTRAGDFYQESIKDTVHMLEYYGDAIVMRHFQQGAPAEAARWSSVPIINAGDGWHEHPTQGLLDLLTIYGTRILWPFDDTPRAWPVLFIVDPLVTAPLVAGVVADDGAAGQDLARDDAVELCGRHGWVDAAGDDEQESGPK